MSSLTQNQLSQYRKYNYFFTIVFRGVYDNIVYYYVEYGKNEDTKAYTREFINKYRCVLRYSELRKCNVLLNYFPSRTLFTYTDDKFVNSRVKGFKEWINVILEQNKAEQLYQFLEGERLKQDANSSRLCFGILSEESE